MNNRRHDDINLKRAIARIILLTASIAVSVGLMVALIHDWRIVLAMVGAVAVAIAILWAANNA